MRPRPRYITRTHTHTHMACLESPHQCAPGPICVHIIHTLTHTHTFSHIYTDLHTYLFVCVCVCVCLCVCVCVCVCLEHPSHHHPPTQGVIQQVRTLKKFRHLNIVEYKGACVRGGTLHLLMELCDGGSIASILHRFGVCVCVCVCVCVVSVVCVFLCHVCVSWKCVTVVV